jgi:hypothetical protein
MQTSATESPMFVRVEGQIVVVGMGVNVHAVLRLLIPTRPDLTRLREGADKLSGHFHVT